MSGKKDKTERRQYLRAMNRVAGQDFALYKSRTERVIRRLRLWAIAVTLGWIATVLVFVGILLGVAQ